MIISSCEDWKISFHLQQSKNQQCMHADIVAKWLSSRAGIFLGIGTGYVNTALGTGVPKSCDNPGEEFCSEEPTQAGLLWLRVPLGVILKRASEGFVVAREWRPSARSRRMPCCVLQEGCASPHCHLLLGDAAVSCPWCAANSFGVRWWRYRCQHIAGT